MSIEGLAKAIEAARAHAIWNPTRTFPVRDGVTTMQDEAAWKEEIARLREEHERDVREAMARAALAYLRFEEGAEPEAGCVEKAMEALRVITEKSIWAHEGSTRTYCGCCMHIYGAVPHYAAAEDVRHRPECPIGIAIAALRALGAKP